MIANLKKLSNIGMRFMNQEKVIKIFLKISN